MKKALLLGILMAFATPLFAQEFIITPRPERRVAPPVEEPAVQGGIPRAVRSGNPLQMLNPFAPREYGSGRDFVYYADATAFERPPEKESRPKGIRLFSFTF